MLKPSIFILFVCCLLACNTHKRAVSVDTTQATCVAHFAEQVWDSIAKKIPQGMEEAFGFRSFEDIENSSIGEPVKMYYWQEGNMVASNNYRVPILVEGKMVSLLTVSANEDMTSNDFGGSLLAHNIQLISEKYRVNITGILRIHLLRTDFLIFEKDNTSYFIPLTAHTLQDLSQKNILKINDIMTITKSE